MKADRNSNIGNLKNLQFFRNSFSYNKNACHAIISIVKWVQLVYSAAVGIMCATKGIN